jgi:hypothetical protein
MNDEYFKEQSRRVRAIAEKADPFTKKRLLALADSYDIRLGRPSRATRQLQLAPMDLAKRTDQNHGGGESG